MKKIIVVISFFLGLCVLSNELHAQHYTGIYVNGYELKTYEKNDLEFFLGPLPQGWYHLDKYGNFWKHGYPQSINLFSRIQAYYQSYKQVPLSQKQTNKYQKPTYIRSEAAGGSIYNDNGQIMIQFDDGSSWSNY